MLESSLAPAITATHEAQAIGRPDGGKIALGWQIDESFGRILWHNGGTGGYRSFIGFDPQRRFGVVVLSNSAISVDDIGLHILDSRYPLGKIQPKGDRKEVALDSKITDAYVGNYALNPGFVIRVTKEGGRVFVQATGQQKIEAFAERPADFFLKAVDAQISFTRDAIGNVDALILHQNGIDQIGKRQS